jgi:hypothetical protein
MYFKAFIALVLSMNLFVPGVVLSAEQFKLLENPITFQKFRAPSGKPFDFKLTLKKDVDPGSCEVFFIAGGNRVRAYVDAKKEKDGGKAYVWAVKSTVPSYDEIFKGVDRKWYEGWWRARKATVLIKIPVGKETYEKSAEFAVPLQLTATLWGLLVLFILYMLIFLMKLNLFPKDKRFEGGEGDKRIQTWQALYKSPFTRKLIGPFHLTATPIGNYSISKSQILFWSAIVIFASVYVFYCRSDFIDVTGQVLTLLGISGGTALAAKGNALIKNRDIPDEFFKGIERTRVPRFRDIICISGIPNIFKFQIFAFTLVNGIIVLQQLYTSFNFPVIPDMQLTLMGISNGVYLGNEIVRGSEWEAISKKVEAADKARNKDEEKFNRLTGEIKGMLESIYKAE